MLSYGAMATSQWVSISDEVMTALADGLGVVALESTVIAHGLPYPANLETALACETAVRTSGSIPATVGVVDGRPTIGLSGDQIAIFANQQTPSGMGIAKVSLNNLAAVMHGRGWGATTVAGSLRVATLGGASYDLRNRPLVFSTGGIGGVHRGASESFDVSADLAALGGNQIVCVTSGAKSILDLSATLEMLETLGVPVIGYQTAEFPAFYSRESGLKLENRINSSADVASVALLHWQTSQSAVLVCVPPPDETALSSEGIDDAIQRSLDEANRQRVRGKALTPFVLDYLNRETGGDTLGANRALLVNNARVAGEIACELARESRSSGAVPSKV